MRLRVRVGAWLAWTLGVPVGVTAQRAPSAGTPWRYHDATVSFVEARDGIASSAVYVVHRAADGTLRLGTDGGLLRYTGHRWVRDDQPAAYDGQVRALLEFDGWLWIAGRRGVMRRLRDSSETYDAVTGGLPDAVVYSIEATRAFGKPTVVVGTARGVARWSGRGFIPVPLPDSIVPIGVTLAATDGADGRTPTLWVASATRGVARYAGGQWHLEGPADGLTLSGAEQLLAAPTGSDVELYAVDDDGVFERRAGRWSRVATPNAMAYRALSVTRRNGRQELWLGTQSGRVFRRLEDGRWDTVSVARGRAPTPVLALTAVPTPTGEPMVYVGLRGDRLARVGLGPAREIELADSPGPRFLRALVLDSAADFTAWAGSIGSGVVRTTHDTTIAYGTADGLPDRNVFAVLPIRGPEGLEVWAATGRGPVRYRNGRWQTMTDGLGASPGMSLALVHGRDGTPAVAMAGYEGVHVWNGRQWVRDTALPPGIASVVAEAPGPDGATMWAAVALGLFRRAGNQWVPERPFGSGPVSYSSVQGVRMPGGDSAVFVTSGQGMAWRRARDTAWRVVSPATHPGLRAPLVWQVVSGGDRLYAATPLGALQFRWVTRDSLELETAYGEPDGLPSSEVLSVAAAPSGRVLVATIRGLGQLPPAAELPTQGAPRLFAWLRRNVDGDAVVSGDALPHDIGLIEAELGLQSFYREDDTQYRVQLEGSGNPPTAWSSRTTYTFAALRPGTYVLHAWARDWRGREATLAPISFVIRPPWWTSWPALAAYVLGLGVAIVLLVRARVASLKQRADELERNERRVAASERKFRALFDLDQDAHLLVEGQRIVAANDAARALVGVADPAQAAAWLASLAVAAAPEVLDEGARLVPRADGTMVPVREQRTTVVLEDRTLEHVVLRDISAVRAARAEAARLESQLREAQRLESIGTLAGGVAHDFNNLLSIIRGNAELARDLAESGSAPTAELAELLRATDRARDLVKQILTFSRRSPSRRERVDVARLVHDLRGMLRATIPSTVEVRITGPSSGCLVDGDATQLHQALLNLCTNAEYAMRATNGGRLTIGVEGATPAHPVVTITVSDTGTGMPTDVRDRVFEPFFTTKPVGEGTGLGLSVLHGIVAAHGGDVAIDSAQGTGTRVTITLPASPEAGPTPTTAGHGGLTIEAPRGSGEHVVVVDDEPAIRAITERALTSLGYAVRTFEDPRAALAVLTDPAAPVNVLVTDQTMPGMTGDVLVTEARRARPGLPALIVTGFSHRLTAARIAELGVPVLQKPLGLADLGRAVADALGVSSPGRSRG